MKDYLSKFLTGQAENAGALKSGNRQNRQKAVKPADEKRGRSYCRQPTKPTKGSQTGKEGAFVGFVGDRFQERADFLVTTGQIRLYRQRYHPAPTPDAVQTSTPAAVETLENIEMHDSALFDVTVSILFHGGPDGPAPLRIPQQSTPPGWWAPF